MEPPVMDLVGFLLARVAEDAHRAADLAAAQGEDGVAERLRADAAAKRKVVLACQAAAPTCASWVPGHRAWPTSRSHRWTTTSWPHSPSHCSRRPTPTTPTTSRSGGPDGGPTPFSRGPGTVPWGRADEPARSAPAVEVAQQRDLRTVVGQLVVGVHEEV